MCLILPKKNDASAAGPATFARSPPDEGANAKSLADAEDEMLSKWQV